MASQAKPKHEDKHRYRNSQSAVYYKPFLTQAPSYLTAFASKTNDNQALRKALHRLCKHLLENHEAGYKIMIELAHECKLVLMFQMPIAMPAKVRNQNIELKNHSEGEVGKMPAQTKSKNYS